MSQWGASRIFREDGAAYVVRPHVASPQWAPAGRTNVVESVLVEGKNPPDAPAECKAALAFVGKPYGEWLDGMSPEDQARAEREEQRRMRRRAATPFDVPQPD